ncbi:MAG: urease accessory protein UreD, partial [Oceanospirillales bacterium]
FLGPQTEPLLQQMVKVWQLVRPDVMGRKACLPRIWAT